MRRHQSLISSASVVASRNPCLVTGSVPPGWRGNTGHPRDAQASAWSTGRSRDWLAFLGFVALGVADPEPQRVDVVGGDDALVVASGLPEHGNPFRAGRDGS